MPSHIHPYRLFVGDLGTTITDSKQGKFMAAHATSDIGLSFYCAPGESAEFHIYSAGNDEHHNNVGPCIPVYCWHRTA